jgi:hypothetical protein
MIEIAVLLVILVLIALLWPARYDPAIRLKEWNERE